MSYEDCRKEKKKCLHTTTQLKMELPPSKVNTLQCLKKRDQILTINYLQFESLEFTI